jgi:CheY-like chemotaxis protein
MGGDLSAESPSGIAGERGTKVTFTLTTYSNDRPIKDLNIEMIKSFTDIKTLIITGNQNRDEEVLGALHKLGLIFSVTTFQKSTVSQIKENVNFPADRYNLVIIIDDEEFNGFETARVLLENNLSGNFIIIMVSSNDRKGNFLKCITMGVDHYMIKPFDSGDLAGIIKMSFPYIEDHPTTVGTERTDTGIKILIVEDNIMNQKVIGTMLKNLGYSFDISNNGYEGYLQSKLKKYDLIFMDLIMPEMDGFESTRKILEYDDSVLIVAFTADNLPESKRKAELSGIKDFISKPVRIEELRKLFARYFKK